MDYSKYYTPPKIADLLIKNLHIKAPNTIIDICCGQCNLLSAAARKWKSSLLIGVDIAGNWETNLKVSLIKEDGREYSLKEEKKYPLILANPPFSYIDRADSGKYNDLYKIFPFKYKTARLENEMLLANLHLLEKNGMLVIIMPNTFVEGEVHRQIRKYLASQYFIQKIFCLPPETFGNTRINTYAIFIKKSIINKSNTKYYSVEFKDNQFIVSEKQQLCYKNIKKGNWANGCDVSSEKIFEFDFKRGMISSQFFKDAGIPVLHTSKKQVEWYPSIRYIDYSNTGSVFAEPGDIIISRIGKSAGEWTIYKGNKILISDCLYRIKDSEKILTHKLMGKKYNLKKRGVAVNYITKQDFIEWYKTL